MKVAIGGITGKMGQVLQQEISKNTEFDTVVINKQLIDPVPNFDIFIDFSRPEGTLRYLSLCYERRLPMVIGTTGFSDAQIERIVQASHTIPIVMAANFSIGITLLLTLLEQATRTLGKETDIEIIEAHHRHKVDTPSGTALAMGETIAAQLNKALIDCAVFDRHKYHQGRAEASIGFTSIRAGNIVGEHTALFVNDAERLEISHKTTTRATFALGALKAAKWVNNKPPKLYSMRDVLNL